MLTRPMPKGRGFLGCSQRTRQAHPKVKRCDRLTRALGTWLSPPLHRRKFPQALRYCRQSTTRRARAPFIPSPEGRGLLTEKDNTPESGARRVSVCRTQAAHSCRGSLRQCRVQPRLLPALAVRCSQVFRPGEMLGPSGVGRIGLVREPVGFELGWGAVAQPALRSLLILPTDCATREQQGSDRLLVGRSST